jgi:hypothetical protein
MSNGVDATMQPVKPRSLEPMADGVLTHSRFEQLASRDGAMLAMSDLGDHPIDPDSCLGGHRPVKSSSVKHGRQVGCSSASSLARNARFPLRTDRIAV